MTHAASVIVQQFQTWLMPNIERVLELGHWLVVSGTQQNMVLIMLKNLFAINPKRLTMN